mmetsp:Transcript_9696/g.34387  ORF Transcript_9696/g.34387 Transcript_9696/m.34387 type:complete len:109 (+) Transcript_9696:482-808(+)
MHDHHASLRRVGGQGAPTKVAGVDVELCERHTRDQSHPAASAPARNKCIPASKAEDWRDVIMCRNSEEKLRKSNRRKGRDQNICEALVCRPHSLPLPMAKECMLFIFP